MIFDDLQANDYTVTTIRGDRRGFSRFGFFSFFRASTAGGAGV